MGSLAGVLAAWSFAVGWAQQAAAAHAPAILPTGFVTGSVICGDTHRPARYAQVWLKPVSSNSNGGGVETNTGLDGTFTVLHVAPGDYYVQAYVPGYLSEYAIEQSELDAGVEPKDVLAQIPEVHVGSGSSSTNLTLVRGGAISGRVQWEDGSPATDITVNVLPVKQPKGVSGMSNSWIGSPSTAQTDDRGVFRFIGLAEGEYLVQAWAGQGAQKGGGSSLGISAYAPGVFRKSEAAPVTVHLGEERDEIGMVLNLNALHSVSGHVNSSTVGQTITSGSVALIDSTDNDLQMLAQIDANGDFSIPFVPSGNYRLLVSSARAEVSSAGGHGGAQKILFGQQSQALAVADDDVTGLSFTLKPVSAQ